MAEETPPAQAQTMCSIPEEKICKEEDDSHNLCSRWGEGPGMKDVEVNPPASESRSSSEHLESDCLVNSETKSEDNWEQSKHTASVMIKGKRTRDIKGRFVDARRGPGHPPLREKMLIEALNDQEPAGVDAVEQKEYSNTIPCTVSMASHNNDEQPNNVDGPIISDPPHNEVSGPPSISDCKPEDVPVVPKRKRGRPRKTAATTTEKTADTSAVSAPVDKDSRPATRLCSRRKQQLLTPDRKIKSEFEVDLKPIPTLVHTSNNKRNHQGIKRGRPKLSYQQIPANVSRHSVSHEASSMLCSNRAKEESSEGIKCLVCGKVYYTISDLHQHYLQHARGQL